MVQENRDQLTKIHEKPHPEGRMPMRMSVLALAPAKGKTPWWARGQRFSHIVSIIADVVWDQPIRGKGRAYDLESWLDSAGRDRTYVAVTLEVPEHSPMKWRAACRQIEGRRGQPIRTLLRHLGLWKWVPWNCTSPVRILLGAMGVTVTGETPDDIIRELAENPDD